MYYKEREKREREPRFFVVKVQKDQREREGEKAGVGMGPNLGDGEEVGVVGRGCGDNSCNGDAGAETALVCSVGGEDTEEDLQGLPIIRPGGLSDEEWRRRRNRLMIAGMLDLENPTLVDKTVQFLLRDGMCDVFVSFITQVPDDLILAHDPPHTQGGEYETREIREEFDCRTHMFAESVTVEVQRSYRAMTLLTSECPSKSLQTLLAQRAKCITSALFKVFWEGARGSFYHTCRVLDYLIRFYSDQVFDAVGHNAKCVERHFGPSLKWLAHPPVSDTVISKIIAAPGTRSSGPNGSTPGCRWKLLTSLSEWRLLLRLGQLVYDLNYPQELASACADLMLDVVDGLSGDESGELLLQPIGHCPELVNGLVDVACSMSAPQQRRTDATRVLVGLLKKVRSSLHNGFLCVDQTAYLCSSLLRPLRTMSSPP